MYIKPHIETKSEEFNTALHKLVTCTTIVSEKDEIWEKLDPILNSIDTKVQSAVDKKKNGLKYKQKLAQNQNILNHPQPWDQNQNETDDSSRRTDGREFKTNWKPNQWQS